jgi:glycosyltransferase involved in cell wall biosynthesis
MSEKEYPYKVSASIITYNQVEYIEKAIEGALKQEVDFPYEIIIGDDCSTDDTREILLDYKQRYPDLIKLNLHDEHYEGIPGRLNNITNIQSARGKYIAFCDGDDYWISKDKLQKQADFMDANSGYSFCCHDAWEEKNGTYHKPVSSKFFEFRKASIFSFTDIASKRFHFSSVSLFMRKAHLKNLPDWFWNVYTADLALQFIAAKQGPCKYFNDIWGAHRIHERNISKEYFFGTNYLEVLKNDEEIYHQQFPITRKKFLNIRSEFNLIESTTRFKRDKYFEALSCLIKSIYYDKRALGYAFWKILARINQKFTTIDPPASM